MPAALLNKRELEKIEHDTTVVPINEIASFLQDKLGQKFTAYISGLNDPKEVGAWIQQTVTPRSPKDMRLRYAYRVARMILKAYGADTVKAWLFGTNTRLRDEAPAFLIRNAQSPEDLKNLIPVARAFAGSAD